jgi:hypothetical protein
MSWLFSQALVEEFSAGTCSDGEPSAQLNVMPTPHKFWRNDKTIECSDLSRFGRTCAVLTESRGAELLMSFREAFRARTSVLPAKVQDSTAQSPASGEKWHGSWARFDPATSSWRTPQFSLLGGLEPFSETWPRSGLMRDGACFPLPNAEPLTSANESGLWPTPCTPNGGRVNKASGMAKKWATPTTRDYRSEQCSVGYQDLRDAETRGKTLGWMAKSWSASTEKPGSLSPEFHLWLMGWPTGWTALEPLEMDRYRSWQQQHGACLAGDERKAA